MGASKSSKAPASSPPSPAPAAATSTKDAELVKQIAALIVPEMTSSAEERLKENAQREFWTEMRELLSVNQWNSVRQYPVARQAAEKKKKKSPTKEAPTEALLALEQGLPSPKRAKPITPPSTLGKRKQTPKSDDEQKIKFPKPTPTPTPGLLPLQVKKDKDEYDLPKIPPLRFNEESLPGYSPIKHRDGTFTALQAAPLEKPIDERDSDSFEPDSSDEDEVEVIETKAPAPKFAA
eukprot:jgi/Phyca11/21973/fgenesh1_pg.PHYCAscaffold_310_\